MENRKQEIDRRDWVWYFLTPLAGYLLYYVGTGIGPLQGAGQAINGPAWASILLLVVGIRNAWDLVVWMILSKREPTQSE